MIPANLGKRFVALLIDGLVIGLAKVIVLSPIFGKRIPVVIAIVNVVYWALMESSKYRATLGKMAMGLYVADLDGNPISIKTAFIRAAGKIFSSVIAGIGFLVAFFTERKQTLHDLIAKTVVLQKPKAAPAPAAAPGSGSTSQD